MMAVAEGTGVRKTHVQFNKENKQWEGVADSERQIYEKIYRDLEEKLKSKQGHNEKPSPINKRELVQLIDNSIVKVITDLAKQKNNALEDKLLDSFLEKKNLPTYLIYTPDEIILREQNSESAIKPLGIHGEGLFAFLKEQMKAEKELFAKLNEGLNMLDWFDGLKVPEDLLSNEARLLIGDRYLKKTMHFFDQRSTNEGFLFLLFYLTLFHSKETPSFFAIDNIESSLNPKLCMHLVRYLIETAKTNDKQVILTTHSPFVLDALDLSDDEQRLFVARRDIDGHTRISRIEYKPERTQKLSEVWMNGYIGGLPDNF